MMQRLLGIFLLSVFLLSFSLISLWTGLGYVFSVNLPIAIRGNFPIPVFYWAGIGLYSLAIAFYLKKSFLKNLKRMLPVGFLLHLLLSFLRLKVQITDSPQIFSALAYRWYCELFILSSFILLAFFCAKVIHGLRINLRENTAGYFEAEFRLPFLVLFFYILFYLLLKNLTFYVFLIIAIFGCFFYLCSSTGKGLTVKLISAVAYLKKILLQEKGYLSLIFLFALLIRIFYLSRIMGTPEYIDTGSDGRMYDGLAYSYLKGEKVTEALVAGYWIFLSFIYKIFGRSYFAVGAIQGILTSLSCIFIYYSGKYIFNIKVARTAALVAAISFSSIFSASAIGHQALDIFYVTLGLMLVSRYAYYGGVLKLRYIFLILLGIVWGLSIATREINFFYPIIIICWFMFYLSRRRAKKEVLIDGIIILFFIALVLLPFIYRNIKNLGVWYPISSTEGTDYPLIESYLRGENPDLVKAGIDFSKPQAILQLFLEKPSFVLCALAKNYWVRFKELYFSQGYGGFDMLFLYRLSDYYYALWFYVYVLTTFGILAAFKRYRMGAHLLLFLFVFYRTIVHFFTEGSYRHRAPIEPFLLLYLVYGFYVILGFCTGKGKEKSEEI